MNIFGRKKAVRPRAKAEQSGDDGNSAPVSHRLTLNLARAENLAAMLARSRAARVIEVADLLAGMYISDWDRLSKYWEERRRGEVELFLQRICGISPQRWHSWIEVYDGERRKDEKAQGWNPLRVLAKEEPDEEPLRQSAALASILKQAELIAPFRDISGGKRLPILTGECVLLCIARNAGTDIGRKLSTTGLDAAKLEKDALHPKRGPIA
jgi:hypothetical protein